LTNDATTYETFIVAPLFGTEIYDSKTLVANNYKFAVPSTSEIVGIKVDLFGWAFGGIFATTINRLRLLNSDGAPRATVKGSGDPFISDTYGGVTTPTTYGGATDLWGEAAGFWTPDKVNSVNFGCDIQGRATATGPSNINNTASYTVQGLHMTVYTNKSRASADIRLQYKARTNDFYTYPYTRAVLKNCTINAIEFGTKAV
jgi:hypothetical protein